MVQFTKIVFDPISFSVGPPFLRSPDISNEIPYLQIYAEPHPIGAGRVLLKEIKFLSTHGLCQNQKIGEDFLIKRLTRKHFAKSKSQREPASRSARNPNHMKLRSDSSLRVYPPQQKQVRPHHPMRPRWDSDFLSNDKLSLL